jgi:hypothetical protein
MKKILLVSFALLFVGLVPHAFAQGFVPLAGIPGLTEGSAANSNNFADFFNNLYKYLIGLAAVLAIIEIIWGGLEISTQDSVSKNQAGKDRIYAALFGLVLVLSPVLVFSIINPSILNLSLSLPELDTAPANTSATCPVGQTGTPPNCAPRTCRPGSPATANCTIFREDWYASGQIGAYCFSVPKTASQPDNFYCASDADRCRIAQNGVCSFGESTCSGLTSPCTSY